MSYNAKDIKILEGLDAVRMRPGMYIGTTGPEGMHHLLWEIVDNAIDEAANGFADNVIVTLSDDNTVSVEDNGRGMPTDIHPQKGISGVEVIFTQLHAGGKFDNTQYRYSGGLHGVGASVVNALSEWTTVEVYSNYKTYRAEFARKYDTDGKHIISGATVMPLKQIGTCHKHGSLVSFKPDKLVFGSALFNFDIIAHRLKELAFLNAGLKIDLIDNRTGIEKEKHFCFLGGISDFVKYSNEGKTPLFEEPIVFSGEYNGIKAEAAIQYTDAYSENIISFVNNIPTKEGGTHETGFRSAITKVLNDYARSCEVLKEKDPNFNGEDFREGMTAIIAIKMQNIQFEGQTKAKLGSVEARPAVEAIISEQFEKFLENPKNEAIGKMILEKAVQAAKVREAAKKAKDIARKKNSLDVTALVGKLASCTGRHAEENELIIVEGDSAGGSAKQGRDRHFQAILPLRGKPANCEKRRIEQILSNEEYCSLITALGTGIEDDFDISLLKYNKIIILADADQDGGHIRSLLLTFFYRYMKPLITEGHVFIGTPPLYRLEKNSTKELIYCYSDEERIAAAEKLGRGYVIQRYKGLGEMDPEQLWDTTLNPEKRTLVKVTIDDAAEAERLVTVLMGDKVDIRRQYIIENANFNKIDNFAKDLGVK